MFDLELILASPRGSCAGVIRAIDIVEKTIIKYGAPIYVRHEIVHNKYVVNMLKDKGAIFVEELSKIPIGSYVIFSAHGVSIKVEEEASNNGLLTIDATCPLVTKVHLEAQKAEENNRKIILIGHNNHPEIEGTSGRVKQKVYIVSNIDDIEKIPLNVNDNISYVTQTTLSVDDTKNIIDSLKKRFPNIEGPDLKDICYATQNRQNAVKELATKTELILVIGSANSSNSNRLRDLALELGRKSYLINDYKDIDLNWFINIKKVGITAGASAPDLLLDEVIEFMKSKFKIELSVITSTEENVKFKLPKQLRN